MRIYYDHPNARDQISFIQTPDLKINATIGETVRMINFVTLFILNNVEHKHQKQAGRF